MEQMSWLKYRTPYQLHQPLSTLDSGQVPDSIGMSYRDDGIEVQSHLLLKLVLSRPCQWIIFLDSASSVL